MQPLLRDGRVAVDLAPQQRYGLLQIHCIRKLQNIRHVQHALIRQIVLGGICDRLFQQNLAVPFLPDDIAVAVGDMHRCGMLPGPAGQPDIQHPGRIGAGNLNRSILRIGRDGLVPLRRDIGNDLQDPPRVTGCNARRYGRADALQPSGVGDDNAFHVFNDIAGNLRPYPFRPDAQDVPEPGGGIGQGNRLRAARCGNQLLA